MPDYRRAWHPDGTFFFTVNLLQRHGNDLLTRHIDSLRNSVQRVRRLYPFHIHGWVVLPDHLHCVMELPPQDSDFALRWLSDHHSLLPSRTLKGIKEKGRG